ncbi:DUF4238 domain-containing protein [Nocardia niwae]|uniref:DUF4238 domain-containing protein n=1 Tax=Nocardia niwae TaxID=626084 RepID=UPI0033F281EA
MTSDEPVTLIGSPGTDRGEKPGFAHCTAIVFPLSPARLLALFPPGSDEPRYPYVLNAVETREINAELMAFADTAVFEQPGSKIAESIDVPARAGRTDRRPRRQPRPALSQTVAVGAICHPPAATGRALARTGEVVGPQQRNRLPGARLRPRRRNADPPA